jgi:hypothetical protein
LAFREAGTSRALKFIRLFSQLGHASEAKELFSLKAKQVTSVNALMNKSTPAGFKCDIDHAIYSTGQTAWLDKFEVQEQLFRIDVTT